MYFKNRNVEWNTPVKWWCSESCILSWQPTMNEWMYPIVETLNFKLNKKLLNLDQSKAITDLLNKLNISANTDLTSLYAALTLWYYYTRKQVVEKWHSPFCPLWQVGTGARQRAATLIGVAKAKASWGLAAAPGHLLPVSSLEGFFRSAPHPHTHTHTSRHPQLTAL